MEEDKKTELPHDFAQTLHERARSSSNERRKLLVLLATAGIGVFFIVMTNEINPALSIGQKIVAFLSVIFLASTVISGIIALHADARRNYNWALALTSIKESDVTFYKMVRDKWFKIKKISDFVLYASFVLAILLSFLFVVLRII